MVNEAALLDYQDYYAYNLQYDAEEPEFISRCISSCSYGHSRRSIRPMGGLPEGEKKCVCTPIYITLPDVINFSGGQLIPQRMINFYASGSQTKYHIQSIADAKETRHGLSFWIMQMRSVAPMNRFVSVAHEHGTQFIVPKWRMGLWYPSFVAVLEGAIQKKSDASRPDNRCHSERESATRW